LASHGFSGSAPLQNAGLFFDGRGRDVFSEFEEVREMVDRRRDPARTKTGFTFKLPAELRFRTRRDGKTADNLRPLSANCTFIFPHHD